MNRIRGVGTRQALVGLALGMVVMVGCDRPASSDTAGAPAGVLAEQEAWVSGPPFLVRDLWQADATLYRDTRRFVAADGQLYFSNTTPSTGEELWKTDGTTAGTVLVRDLIPGPDSSVPRPLAELGGWLYFSATTPGVSHHYALWRTRGTPESTEYVHSLGDEIPNITRMGDALYYFARGGLEIPWVYSLWRLDGTAAGPRPLKGMQVNRISYSLETAQANGTLFFWGIDAEHGQELWKTDGTVEGTVLVRDIQPGPESTWRQGLFAMNGLVLFWANDAANSPSRLWRSDGTPEGTFRLEPLRPDQRTNSGPTPVAVVGDVAWFSARDTEHGQELWRTDGTVSGTYPLDLRPGPQDFLTVNLTAFAGQLYFEASSQGECMLWKSDGTVQGTTPMVDVQHGTGCAVGNGGRLLATPTSLYFFANPTDSSPDLDLWKSDGTAAGTVRLTNGLNARNSRDFLFTSREGTVYFTARGGELWTSDGTPEGTRVLLSNTGKAASSYPVEAVNFRGTLFFAASKGANSQELWMSDGTAEGTEPLTDVIPENGIGGPTHLLPADNQLYFLLRTSTYPELWRTDGTRDGTRRVASTLVTERSALAVLGDELFFLKRFCSLFMCEGAEYELWKTDGTAGRETLVKEFPIGSRFLVPTLTPVGRQRLFLVRGAELWVSDGTPEGTRTLVVQTPDGRRGGLPHQLVAVGDTLFFFATIGEELLLWKSDGTQEGTVHVSTHGTSASVGSRAVVGGTLYFLTHPSSRSSVLWKSDGTTTERITEIPRQNPAASAFLTASGGALYFWAFDEEHGYELWKSDGTEAGTRMLTELNPGMLGAVVTPGPLVALGPGEPLVFAASDGVSGLELWQTDGTAQGTVRVADIAPGADSSSPTALTVAGRHLFFSAWRKDTGFELWALRRTPTDTTAPEVVCPASQSVEATGPQGAQVTFSRPTATDDTDPRPVLIQTARSGDYFPVGVSSVKVTAKDASGNEAQCTFSIEVKDTGAPSITCPPRHVVAQTSVEGAVVTYPEVAVEDAISTPRVEFVPANGSLLPVGSTEVTATAIDAGGNTARCIFQVQVLRDPLYPDPNPPPPPPEEEEEGGWGCTQTGGAPLALLSLLALGVLGPVRGVRRRGSSRP